MKVKDSVISRGIRTFNGLTAVELSPIAQGTSTLSSSIVNVLFTACIDSFELMVRLASRNVNLSFGNVTVMSCRDPCKRFAGYDTCLRQQ